MKGQIQLRNKEHFHDYNYKDNENGDGIGIAFQLGNSDELGIAGGDLGIGGLPDAIGCKFDTFFNKDGNTYPQTNPKALPDDKINTVMFLIHQYQDHMEVTLMIQLQILKIQISIILILILILPVQWIKASFTHLI